MNPLAKRSGSALVDDGVEVRPWTVLRRYGVGLDLVAWRDRLRDWSLRRRSRPFCGLKFDVLKMVDFQTSVGEN